MQCTDSPTTTTTTTHPLDPTTAVFRDADARPLSAAPGARRLGTARAIINVKLGWQATEAPACHDDAPSHFKLGPQAAEAAACPDDAPTPAMIAKSAALCIDNINTPI